MKKMSKKMHKEMKKERHFPQQSVAKAHKPKGDHWIQDAIKKPGSLRKELHAKKGHKIPLAKLEKAEHAKGKEGRRARLALTLRNMKGKK